ncbi:MAG: HAMP domain-containing protein [Alphaproteobacteria bacterium]|nr:HAMP domain-containing protein [Alphaproteobacteria bacterium]
MGSVHSLLKRTMPKTLFGRALIIVVAPVVLLQVILSVVFFEAHWYTVTRRLSLGLAGDIAMVIRLLPDDEERAKALALSYLDLDITYLKGAVLDVGSVQRPFNIPDRMLRQALEERLFRRFAVNTREFGDKVEIRVQASDGVLRILTPRKRLDSTTTSIFVLWMVGSSLILLAIAVVFLRNQMRPIRRLVSAANELGKGRDIEDIRPAGATEIREATKAFLAMRERIQRQVAQRTEMLAGVSHDLRTPLTRMKLELAMAAESVDVRNLENDVRDMETMIEGYLAFARGQDTERPEATDLRHLLQDVVDGARRQGRDVALVASGDLVLPVRPNALKRCIQNLVDNAQRYSATADGAPPHVEILAIRQPLAIEIAVDDRGPGIAPARYEEAFKPFSRLDESRKPGVPGVGLGLTIARDIARIHGGDLTLDRAPIGGLRALVHLPA